MLLNSINIHARLRTGMQDPRLLVVTAFFGVPGLLSRDLTFQGLDKVWYSEDPDHEFFLWSDGFCFKGKREGSAEYPEMLTSVQEALTWIEKYSPKGSDYSSDLETVITDVLPHLEPCPVHVKRFEAAFAPTMDAFISFKELAFC
jgi:hypothetical protein